MFGVSNSLIRYWETEFNALKPAKNKKGDRRFMVKDIRTLEKIYTENQLFLAPLSEK